MVLYLIRHGKAEPRDVDPARGLTAEGRAEVEKAAAFLKPMGLGVEAVWHSTKARAAQTAEAIDSVVDASSGLVERDDLAPNDPVPPIREEVEDVNRDLVVVGHLPFLGRLAGLLLVGDEAAGFIDFQPAQIVCLKRDEEGEWLVSWSVSPASLP